MKTTLGMLICFASVFMALTSDSWGDTWSSAGTRIASSTNGDALVRVSPNDDITPPIALVYDFDAATESYLLKSKFPLRNLIMPYLLAVTPKAKRVVVVEDWGGLGYGRDAIAVYEKDGKVLWHWSLKDLFTSEEILQFPRTTSSIWWVESVTIVKTANGGYSAMISPVRSHLGQPVNTVFNRLLVDLDTGKVTRL